MKAKIITVTLLFSITMLLASCGSKSATNNTVTENAKYQCPMKCEGEKTYDKPRQCPVCNMDLEKVETKQDAHDTTHSNH